jgi:hypothetical protein
MDEAAAAPNLVVKYGTLCFLFERSRVRISVHKATFRHRVFTDSVK